MSYNKFYKKEFMQMERPVFEQATCTICNDPITKYKAFKLMATYDPNGSIFLNDTTYRFQYFIAVVASAPFYNRKIRKLWGWKDTQFCTFPCLNTFIKNNEAKILIELLNQQEQYVSH